MNKVEHWYVPGKTVIEQQHLHEHNSLQALQRLALDEQYVEFEALLLKTFPNAPDKQQAIRELCRVVRKNAYA